MTDPITDAAARKGSAELLILACLERGELHGYDICRAIADRSGGVLTFRAASLYPLLYRLEGRGWIEGRWRQSAGQRRRRCYRLTAEGRTALAGQRTRWSAFLRALSRAAGLRHA
ncbi:MAG TPA: PadR family transcriptional regulator [Vicinamibacterales bacterium]|nr:PadR family transcriptional regulator [Vicinamibacterales bacterium]